MSSRSDCLALPARISLKQTARKVQSGNAKLEPARAQFRIQHQKSAKRVIFGLLADGYFVAMDPPCLCMFRCYNYGALLAERLWACSENMKSIALDIGDVWTGMAISDPLGVIARPYKTVSVDELADFLIQLVPQERISTIVVGLPTTMAGTESEQTVKTRSYVKKLRESIAKKMHGDVKWVWWDERRTSKQAQQIIGPVGRTPKKQALKKHSEHSIAAAIILQGFLDRDGGG